MIKISDDKISVIVYGDTDCHTVVSVLVNHSAAFEVVPLPDDDWRITFKSEIQPFMKEAMDLLMINFDLEDEYAQIPGNS